MTSACFLQSAQIGVCEGRREQKGQGHRLGACGTGRHGVGDSPWPWHLGCESKRGYSWRSEKQKGVKIIQVKEAQGQKPWSTGNGFLFVFL